MECGPACQFKLHAHATIELVYCLEGTLFEVRMDGEPMKVSNTGEAGPDLTNSRRPWKFQSLHQGQWLVNECGSIHKSFTATTNNSNKSKPAMTEGCVLFVMWGGFHADIVAGQEPRSINVDETVNNMDEKISSPVESDGCCEMDGILEETFLPASERTE